MSLLVSPEFLKLENVLSIYLFCASVTARIFETRAIPLSISTLQKEEHYGEYVHGLLLPCTTRSEHQLRHLVCLAIASIYLLCLCLNRLSEYFGSDLFFQAAAAFVLRFSVMVFSPGYGTVGWMQTCQPYTIPTKRKITAGLREKLR